ncbi:hypothetical protein BaRGS_00011597, partial [Batillaria attramentaria]
GSMAGSNKKQSFPVAAVAGGVAASVVAIVVIIVIVLVIRRRCYRTYDRPNRRRDQDENPYTGLRPTGAAANSRTSGDVDTPGVHEEINPGGTQQTSSDSRTYDRPSRRRDQDTNPYTGLRPTGAAASSSSGDVDTRGVHEEINPGGTQQTSSDSRTYDRPSRRRDQDTNLYTGLRPTGAAASRTSGDIDTRGVYEEINPGGTQQTSS